MDHTRHSGLFNLSSVSVGLIGVGGIGAVTALALAKCGVRYIDIWDDDTVDDVNLPTQLHKVSMRGHTKVVSTKTTLEEFSDEVDVLVHTERFTKESEFQGNFLISAVDSIAARKAIWERAKESQILYYLDARMGAEIFHLHTVDMTSPQTYAWYQQLLAGEDDANVTDEPCTQKATFYTALIAGGHIGNAVKCLGMGQPYPRILIHSIRANSLITL